MTAKNLIGAVCGICLFSIAANADIEAGKMALEKGEFSTAIELLQPDLNASDTMLEASWLTGRAYVSMGKPKEALGFLEKAVEIKSDHIEAQYWWGAANGEMAGRASVFSAPGYAKKCKKAFERVLELDPSHVDARAGLVEYYVAAPGFMGGDKEKALLEAREIGKYDQEKSLLVMADVYLSMEKIEEALNTYGEAVEAYPLNPEVRLSRGLVYRELARYDEAFDDFDALFEIAASASDSEHDAAFIKSLGQYYYGAVASKSGLRIDQGVERLEQYVAAAVFDHPFRKGYSQYYLATLYFKQGNIEKAEAMAAEAKKSATEKDLKKKLKKFRK